MNNSQKDFISRFSSRNDADSAAREALNLIGTIDAGTFDITGARSFYEGVLKYSDHSLETSKVLLKFLNERTGKKFEDASKIANVVRSLPKVPIEAFQSVIEHKVREWGDDEKMRQYLRPATIFASKTRFLAYLDDARQYWAEKSGYHE